MYRILLLNSYFWRKTPAMSSNEISIEQINKLDAAAFRLLYKSYYKGLVCYAMRLIELSEPAEDIVQELFSNIWAKKMVFQSVVSFKVYLYNSVRNASREEVYRQLFETIDALPERCREVFLMYMEGKKNEEVATALHVSIETVKTQKKRAMSILRKKLGGYQFLLLQLLLP